MLLRVGKESCCGKLLKDHGAGKVAASASLMSCDLDNAALNVTPRAPLSVPPAAASLMNLVAVSCALKAFVPGVHNAARCACMQTTFCR